MSCNTVQKAAEDWAFNHGTPHGNRDEPAWHHSLLDFKAGVKWAIEFIEEETRQDVAIADPDAKFAPIEEYFSWRIAQKLRAQLEADSEG